MQSFSQMPLQPGTLDAIVAMGYEVPTPIQAQAIGPFLAGQDLLAQARTGTGKTAGFGIPIVDKLRNETMTGVLALVLVPTRELAIQVADECRDIAKASRLRVIEVYGGVGYGRQVDELAKAGPIMLVATPGRLLDLMQQGSCKLDKVRILVLDEADRMLDMGFLPDVEKILRAVPAHPHRQTGLFSATVPDPIARLASKFLRDPVKVKVESGPTAAPLVEQAVVHVEKTEKSKMLFALLHKEQPTRAIVFTRTKHLARRLAEQLQKQGWGSVPLQGNMSQNQRERAMGAFRSGEARLLVATDVAARGIDIPELSHVINYDLPDEPEAYVHRIGRTGRMGRTGKSFTFVQSDEHRDWRTIQTIAGSQVPRVTIDATGTPPFGPDISKPAVVYKGQTGAGPRNPSGTPHVRSGSQGGHSRPASHSRGPSGGYGRSGGRGGSGSRNSRRYGGGGGRSGGSGGGSGNWR